MIVSSEFGSFQNWKTQSASDITFITIFSSHPILRPTIVLLFIWFERIIQLISDVGRILKLRRK